MRVLENLTVKAISATKSARERLLSSEAGASSVEWVLIVAGIAVVIGLVLAVVNGWWNVEKTRIFPSYTPTP
jgi:Flp pilus assembly pilin Flp